MKVYLRNAVTVGDHTDNVIKREEGVALDLGVDVLALCAQRQQLHKVDMVLKGTAVICAVALRPHQLHKSVERTAVIVEQQNFLSCAHQLHGKRKKTKIIIVSGCVNNAQSPIPQLF